ncbi:MAG: hypothetical protein WAN28_11150, partial [Terracidiphilus sp.]
NALLGKDLPERALLAWIIAMERGDWTGCDAVAAAHDLRSLELRLLFEEAIVWAETSLTSMA